MSAELALLLALPFVAPLPMPGDELAQAVRGAREVGAVQVADVSSWLALNGIKPGEPIHFGATWADPVTIVRLPSPTANSPDPADIQRAQREDLRWSVLEEKLAPSQYMHGLPYPVWRVWRRTWGF